MAKIARNAGVNFSNNRTELIRFALCFVKSNLKNSEQIAKEKIHFRNADDFERNFTIKKEVTKTG